MQDISLSPELLDALHKLSSLLEGEDALTTTLNTIVELAVGTLPGCDSCGVTLRAEGKLGTAAASDEYTLEIDRIQYETDEGPCVEALRTGEFREITAISAETRWPDFCRGAAEKGFGSNLSFPLKSDGWAGALNIYAISEGAFDDEARGLGEIYAAQTTIALRNAQIYDAARALARQLDEALTSRDVIGQAKGILMEREQVNPDEAFGMLVTLSQNANIKLREVAQRVVSDGDADDAAEA